MKIDQLEADLEDGYHLHQLLEIISSKKLPKAIQKPSAFQKIQNLNHCFQFMQAEGIKLVGIGPQDVQAKNAKLILGMIWSLFLRYQIVISDEEKGKWIG